MIEATIDFGCFGVKGHDYGEGLHVSLNCNGFSNVTPNISNKRLILLIDTSMSMAPSIDVMKHSIIVASGLLSSHSTNYKDMISIITYDDEAKLVWSGNSQSNSSDVNNTITFEETINNISCQGLTNMGAAIKLAMQVIDNDGQNNLYWLCIMSDGVPNVEPYVRSDQMIRLIDPLKKKSNVKIVTIGYGESVDSSLLEMMGEYSHIPVEHNIQRSVASSSELVYRFFGALVGDMVSTFAYDTTISFDPPLRPQRENCRYLVGESKIKRSLNGVSTLAIGFISNDTSYDLLYMPNSRSMTINSISPLTVVTLSYVTLSSGEVVRKTQMVRCEDTLYARNIDHFFPNSLRTKYFEDCTGRLIRMVLGIRDRGDNDCKLAVVFTKIDLWQNEPLAAEFVALLRALVSESHIGNSGFLTSVGSSYQHQASLLYKPTTTMAMYANQCVRDSQHRISVCYEDGDTFNFTPYTRTIGFDV